MSKCDLHLENYSDHYSPGQTIIGYVECTFTSDKEVNGIIVSFKGEAKTHWTESESRYNSTTKKHESLSVSYNGFQSFIHEENDLLQCGGEYRNIPKGIYKYPFRYTLPLDLPSTFHETLGKIRYNIKAVVKRPMLKFNYEAESELVMVTPVDLNKHPNILNPATRVDAKTTYFCCWSKGDINVEVNIPRTGMAVGEPLPIHVSVQNLSQTNIERIKVKVKKTVEFTVTTPSHKRRRDTDVIFTDQYSGVGAHGENTYDKTIVIDNAALVTNFVDCNIINVKYKMEVVFVVSGMHTNMEVEIPLVLGHIPIGGALGATSAPPAYSEAFGNAYNSPTAPTAPSVPTSYGFVVPQQPAYNPDVIPSMPTMPMPPSYPNNPPYPTPYGGPGGPSASAPFAPNFANAAAVPFTKEKSDEWEVVDDPRNQNLPSYDEAMKFPMKM